MIKKFMKNGAIALIIFSLCIGICAVLIVRNSFPQTSGKITMPGLIATVTVKRDQWGVPHIYAENTHDLFMAQGYVHAQDRFWQMDFWRHIGVGQLADMLGKSQVNIDRFIKTLGWARVAEAELKLLDKNTLEILQAYTDGVNSYLNTHAGIRLSLEYALLKILNPDYQPAPWQIINSLTWGKVMAFDLSFNLDQEIERSILSKGFSPAQIADLFPPYPAENPLIVPDFSLTKKQNKLNAISLIDDQILDDLAKTAEIFDQLKSLINDAGAGIGSNNWVIAGQRTTTGKPLLADDTHLTVKMPSIWYEVGLHCVNKNQANIPSNIQLNPSIQTNQDCPYNVTGFSFAGMAGVIVGHNQQIAWGVTNVGPDVMDLFIEKINPANPNQYEVDGQWQDMQLMQETIKVSDGADIQQTIQYTKHGPIISETYGKLQDFTNKTGIQLPAKYVLSLAYTSLYPSNLATAVLTYNRANNWSEFRQALEKFDIAGQNFVYADQAGNIAYQMTGNIPIRNKSDGRYPVPGWDSQYDWQGYIPFQEKPFVINPESGYIASANNQVVNDNYPYLISNNWDYGYRARRITDMITRQAKISPEYMQKIQGDNYSYNAANLIPVLSEISLTDQRLNKFRDILQNWDYQENRKSIEASIFEVFWRHLLINTFTDDFQVAKQDINDFLFYGEDRAWAVVHNLMKDPNSIWWDDQTTSTQENRDTILELSLTQAVEELTAKFGANPQKWQWGRLHTITFPHQPFGLSGIKPLELLFNRGPFPIAGGTATVNASEWNARQGYQANWLASLRMIADLANWENSLTIHSTGQSGHTFHQYYDNMIKPWLNLQYHPMLWSEEAINSHTKDQLILSPN